MSDQLRSIGARIDLFQKETSKLLCQWAFESVDCIPSKWVIPPIQKKWGSPRYDTKLNSLVKL